MVDINLVKRLQKLANDGDTFALEELKQMNDDMRTTSNNRLYRLEKTNYNYFAYDSAIEFIKESGGNKRFLSSKQLDTNEMVDNIINMNYFLDSKSSLVSFQRKKERESLKWLQESVFKDDSKKMSLILKTDKEKKAFLRFLGSDIGKSFIDIFGTSKGGVEKLLEMRQKNNLTKIKTSINKYLSKKIDYDELFDELGVEL